LALIVGTPIIAGNFGTKAAVCYAAGLFVGFCFGPRGKR